MSKALMLPMGVVFVAAITSTAPMATAAVDPSECVMFCDEPAPRRNGDCVIFCEQPQPPADSNGCRLFCELGKHPGQAVA
ncbi:hypothetical protein [Nocardia sp. CA-119907]|uniref:hypothetical protein n=1 Tax=Nocardia sp. CA-119907 TaxID=3239973 RepID=UPI003D97F697